MIHESANIAGTDVTTLRRITAAKIDEINQILQSETFSLDFHTEQQLQSQQQPQLQQQEYKETFEQVCDILSLDELFQDGAEIQMNMNSSHFSLSNEQNISASENKVMNDVGIASDASTVDEPLNEEMGRSETFVYLTGLNSENLMQFSQQSALQEIMIKEQLDNKGLNVDILPTFENHDVGGYKFELNFRSTSKTKTNWMYLESLNKIYIRMNDTFSVDVVYTPKLPLQPLSVRAFMCFVNEASKPVLRCHNHMNQDKDLLSPMRQSLLRCENPSAQHCGTAEGKSIKDRYSVIVPLVLNGMPCEDKSVKQTIDLKFSCQNSCIGRKETNILFLLEGINGEVFAQRVINVKICSCPKRDMSIDQKNIETSKRKRENDGYSYSRSTKLRKHNISAQRIKEESNSDSEDEGNTKYDVQSTPGGGVRMVMYLCSKEEAVHVLDCARNQVADKILSEPNCRGRYTANYRALKRLRDKALKL